jgi:hypothetical protein
VPGVTIYGTWVRIVHWDSRTPLVLIMSDIGPFVGAFTGMLMVIGGLAMIVLRVRRRQ